MKAFLWTVVVLGAASVAAVFAVDAFAQMNTGSLPTRDHTPLGGGFKEKNKKTNEAQRKSAYQTAKDLMAARRYDEAVTVLLAVVNDDPRNDDAWNDLGYASQRLGRNAEAVGYYERALSIRASRRDTRARLGEVHLALNNLPKAEEQLNQLRQICTSGCDELQTLQAQITAYKAVHAA
jgi:tetratricopeptide (TPR) repeat protein